MLLTDENTPILIVGGGASGLTLGYMLSRLGGTLIHPSELDIVDLFNSLIPDH